MNKTTPQTEWLVTRRIAHRGLHNQTAPENSLAAFERAAQAGFAIELDLQLTADGEVLVFHDDDMKRLLDIDSDIREAQSADVLAATILKSGEHVPTFAQFLEKIRGRVPLLIELKDNKNYAELCKKTLAALENYHGEYAVQSFNPFIVKWFKLNAPQIVRGQLASNFKGSNLAWWKKFLLKRLFFIRQNGSMFVSYDIEAIRRRQILRIKKRLPILAWTTRSQEQADYNAKYYDNIIFENFLPQ